jgi:glutathione synthase/RimK-type ligase-like ATP-grasp enzyme
MTPSPVALVGSPDDAHVAAIARGLEDDGAETIVVNTYEFPQSYRVSLGNGLDSITVDGRSLSRPAAVYVRDVYATPLSPWVDLDGEMEQHWRRTLVSMREKAEVLFSLLARWFEMGVPLYNPSAPEWRLSKPFQLAALESAGLPVPKTLWTNDPDEVRRFADGGRVAYKPVAGGAATKELRPEDLTDERLGRLSRAPVTFQQLLEGDNFRVYCLDGEVVECFRITSEALDFRQSDEVVEQTTLPEDVLEQCSKAAEILQLRWTGMDLRDDGAGTLRFLELNSSPMFLGFDARAGTNVLGTLVNALARHAK